MIRTHYKNLPASEDLPISDEFQKTINARVLHSSKFFADHVAHVAPKGISSEKPKQPEIHQVCCK